MRSGRLSDGRQRHRRLRRGVRFPDEPLHSGKISMTITTNAENKKRPPTRENMSATEFLRPINCDWVSGVFYQCDLVKLFNVDPGTTPHSHWKWKLRTNVPRIECCTRGRDPYSFPTQTGDRKNYNGSSTKQKIKKKKRTSGEAGSLDVDGDCGAPAAAIERVADGTRGGAAVGNARRRRSEMLLLGDVLSEAAEWRSPRTSAP